MTSKEKIDSLKILIPTAQLPVNIDKIKGGVHSALINLLNGFAQLDIQIRVVSFSMEVTDELSIVFSENIHIHYVPEGKYRFHMLNYLINGPSLLDKQIISFKPDLIHFQNGNSFFLIRPRHFHSERTLITVHGFALEEAKRKKKIKDKITWRINGWLNPLLSPGNAIHLSAFSTRLMKQQKFENSTIIPNAVKNIFFDIPLKEKTENKLLYLGIIDNNKNLIFTLKQLNELKMKGIKYHLDVMGGFSNTAYENEIMGYVSKHELDSQIKFHGWVNQEQVLEQLHRSDILIVSSKHESLPMAIAESMAAGKVVLASAVGGIPEMFEDGKSGFLFNLNNPEAVTDLLVKLHDNQAMIAEIAREAKIQAEKKFHCRHVAMKTREFYQKIITSH